MKQALAIFLCSIFLSPLGAFALEEERWTHERWILEQMLEFQEGNPGHPETEAIVDSLIHSIVKKNASSSSPEVGKFGRSQGLSTHPLTVYESALAEAIARLEEVPESKEQRIIVDALVDRVDELTESKKVQSQMDRSAGRSNQFDTSCQEPQGSKDAAVAQIQMLTNDLSRVVKKIDVGQVSPPRRNQTASLSEATGLTNFGATCYINAAIKLMAAHPGLLEHSKKVSAEKAKLRAKRAANPSAEDAFGQEIIRLLDQVQTRQRKHESGEPVKPNRYFTKPLERVLDKYQKLPGNENFSPYVQEDTGLFLMTTLGALGYDEKIGGAKLKSTVYATPPGSVGRVALGSNSNFESNIAIKTTGARNVSQALRRFNAFETLTDGNLLEGVPANIKQEKRLVFEDVGDHLIFTVGRNRGRAGTIVKERFVPDHVIQIPIEKKAPVKMFLKSVTVKRGKIDHGHYYTYSYDSKKQTWFKHNDTSVTPVVGAEAIADAYRDMEYYSTTLLYGRSEI
jgi:hypothetical protein